MNRMAQQWLEKTGRQMGIDLPYFAKNGLWISIRQGVVALSSLAMIAVFSRYVSPEIFGKYQFILSIVSLAMIFSLPGMSTALVQTAARGKDGFYKDAFRRSVRMSIVGSGVLVLVGGYYFLSSVELGVSIFTVAVAFPFVSSFGLWEAYLQGRERFDIAARNASIMALLQALAVCGAAIIFPRYLIAVVLAYAVSIGLANAIYYRASQSTVRNDETEEESVRFGYFMTKMGVLGVLSEQIDKLLVGILLGPSQLAVYAIISFFGLRIKDVVRPFSAMLVPKMATETRLFHEIVKLHWRPLLLGLLSIIAASALFYFLVVPLNNLVFSETYAEYSRLSQWYVVTVLLSVPLTALGYYIYAKQNTYAITLSNTVYHVLRIGINVLMIWNYGLLGVVFAYNLSMLLLLGIYLWGIYHEERVTSSPE